MAIPVSHVPAQRAAGQPGPPDTGAWACKLDAPLANLVVLSPDCRSTATVSADLNLASKLGQHRPSRQAWRLGVVSSDLSVVGYTHLPGRCPSCQVPV
jgi:hypothetical protein